MPNFLQMVSLLREQMNATLSRSDVLKPLAWLIGLLGAATLSFLLANAPEWLLLASGISFVASIILYAGAYIFCLLKDRDALRSEKYSLHKMAIERGVYGDSTTGMIESEAVTPQNINAQTTSSLPLQINTVTTPETER